MKNFKPDGYNSVSPYLININAEALCAFVLTVFEASLLRRFERADGSLKHVELRIDDTVLMIGGGKTDFETSACHLHVYVKDIEGVLNRAKESGAIVIQDLIRKTSDDDLRAGFKDPFGYVWWVAKQ